MKSNWNTTLDRWTRCVPCRAREMVCAAVVENEDVLSTYDDWADADSLTNFNRRLDGGVEIDSTIADKITHTTQDGYNTDLNNASPYSVAQIEWKGSDPRDLEIQKVKAWLHPNQAGTGKEVAKWGCQLKALVKVEDEDILHLVPLGTIAWVEETGSVAHEVTFDFSDLYTKPLVKVYTPDDPGHTYDYPTTFVFIYAVDSDGAPAGSVGWGRDSATASKTTSGNVLKGVTLTEMAPAEYKGTFLASDDAKVPYVTLQSGTVSQQTLEFTSNDFDLSATPSSADEVVFVVQGSERSGSALTASARIPAGSWVEVKDGQTAADVGLAANRYYEMKCVFDPDSTGIVSPILRRFGVEDVALTNLSSVTDVNEIHRQVDPVTLKTYITTAKFVAIQDGVRDFNDAITSLLRSYYIGQIQFRIYWGHPDLDRHYWMEIGRFIEPTYQAIDGAIELTATSPLALVKTTLPKYDTGTNMRAPLTYAGETLKDMYDDLLDGQIELPGRFRGPGIEDDTTTVSRRINEEVEAKDLLEAVAYCDGSAVGEDQGLVQAINLYGDKSVVAAFPSKTIMPVYVSPGYEHRLPQWWVKHDWNEDESKYDEERYYAHGSSLTNLGRAALNPIKDPGDDVMKLVYSSDLADVIGERGVNFFGPGLLTLGFNSIYYHPELGLGDLVAVETDRFVAVDPNTANAVYGHLWILAVIVDHNKRGDSFVVWARDYADIFSSAAAGTITLGLKRFACGVHHDSDQTIYGTGSATVLSFDDESEDVGDMHSTVTNNSRVTVPTGGKGRYSVKAEIVLANDTFDPARAKLFQFKHTRGVAVNYYGSLYFDPGEVGTRLMAVDLDLEDGDILELQGSAPSGGTGSVDVLSNSVGDETRFWVTRRGV